MEIAFKLQFSTWVRQNKTSGTRMKKEQKIKFQVYSLVRGLDPASQTGVLSLRTQVGAERFARRNMQRHYGAVLYTCSTSMWHSLHELVEWKEASPTERPVAYV